MASAVLLCAFYAAVVLLGLQVRRIERSAVARALTVSAAVIVVLQLTVQRGAGAHGAFLLGTGGALFALAAQAGALLRDEP